MLHHLLWPLSPRALVPRGLGCRLLHKTVSCYSRTDSGSVGEGCGVGRWGGEVGGVGATGGRHCGDGKEGGGWPI